MIVKLLTEHNLELLSLKGGCSGSSKSTLVKMSNCWKSHAAAQMCHVVVTQSFRGWPSQLTIFPPFTALAICSFICLYMYPLEAFLQTI